MSKLYIVGTPIGNLEDLSRRAERILREVDFIAAEDTRVTRKLLTHFGISKPMVSYYAHNLRERGEGLAARIAAGETCAIVTDAGMPCISDPGQDLVALCAQRGIAMEVVPGPTAAVSALALSGLPTGRFAFEGFLSVKRSSRMEHLQMLKGETRTLIFYEAPHKLCATLHDMLDVLGDRACAVAKELTKIHETVLRTTLSEAADYFDAHPPRGEYVLVIGGAPAPCKERIEPQDAVRMVLQAVRQGAALSAAARDVAAQTGYRKGELYALAQKEREAGGQLVKEP